MSRASNNLLFKCFYHFLWILFFAKTLSLVASFLLPHTPTKSYQSSISNFGYVNVVLQKTFGLNRKQIKVEPMVTNQPVTLINDMILKGVYIDKKSAYAIIALKKKKNDVKIVSMGEKFNGYKVSNIYPKRVFLQKNEKTYILYLEKVDKQTFSYQPPINKQYISVALRSREVYRYINNFSQIWKKIKIDDIRENGKFKGFIIRWIKPDSIFSRIGLRKGDKIIKVDNKVLRSYKDAFDYYQRLKRKEMQTLRLTVIRNNKEKEIRYELL